MVSVLLYCAGLTLLVFARHPVMLPIAVIIFICGEVLMTPCFDETAKKHSRDAEMGTCMGLLHLVDGSGRLLGAAFALAVYGWMRNSPYQGWYWPVVVSAFLIVCSILHVAAHALYASEDRNDLEETRAPKATAEPEAMAGASLPS
jgi:sugar phosphate permease